MNRFALFVLVAACGSSSKAPPRTTTSTTSMPDAGVPTEQTTSPLVVDAAPAPADETFASPALSLEAPTPAGTKCRANAAADYAHEQQRERAALDRALRANGFRPLVTKLGAKDVDEEEPVPTAPQGGWLVVTQVPGCRPVAPTVAMNGAHEVFVVTASLKPAEQRSISECTSSCGARCGIPFRPVAVLTQVPADAHVAAPRTVDAPIDVAVGFTAVKTIPCNVP